MSAVPTLGPLGESGVYIADDGEFLLASEKAERMRFCRQRADTWAANPAASARMVERHRAMSDEELLSDTYEMFTFCPDCGARLKP